MFGVALAGAAVAGLYGMLHDQVTYSLSPEYFTRMKFDQFAKADFGFPDRIFVAEIGFLATWWVGLIVGWFIARIALPAWPRPIAVRRMIIAFTIMMSCAVVAGIAGFFIGGRPDAALAWEQVCQSLGVRDARAFAQVAYIHNASYVGGLLGVAAAFLYLVHQKRRSGFREPTFQ